MGVHGLWKLIEPSGKPVPVETLDNKVLAVDVSIWLHQLMKGYQTPAGASVSNAYLLGLFSRVCKLLFTNVKPVFVFDGGVPQLKKKTIAARQQQKNKSAQVSEKLREQLLKNLLKQKAVSQVLEEIRGQTSPKKKAPDMFELPPLPHREDSASEVEEIPESSSEEDVKPVKMKFKDLHSIDVNSAEFRNLPADMRHDILTELKETRKQNSWGRIHEMPEESNDFSKYQMSRLLKRRSVQVSLEEAEKEMGGRTLSLHDVEALLAEGGIEINPQLGKRIASDDVTRFIYVREGDQLEPSQNVKISELNYGKEENSKHPFVKIKEEVISSDELSDSELMREVEAIETVHSMKEEEAVLVNKVENEEFATDDIFENESSSEETFLNDITLMKENSGLSQEQILAIIRDQNRGKIEEFDHNSPSTSKDVPYLLEEYPDDARKDVESSTVGTIDAEPSSNHQAKTSAMLYFKMIERMYDYKTKEKTSQKKEIKKGPKLSKDFVAGVLIGKRNQADTKPVDLSVLASTSSDSDQDSQHNLPCKISELVLPNISSVSIFKRKGDELIGKKDKHVDTVGVEKVTNLSSSESDDDFVEVSPCNESDISKIETKNSSGIHIEIQATNGPLENDIFADVFLDKYKANIENERDDNLKCVNGNHVQIEIQHFTGPIKDDTFSNKTNNSNKNVKIKRTENTGDKDINFKKVDEIKVALKKNAGSYINENIPMHANSDVLDNSTDDLLPDLEKENIICKHERETILAEKSLDEQLDDCENKDNSRFPSIQKDQEKIGANEEVDDPISKEDRTVKNIPNEIPKRKLNTKQLEKLQEILETKEQEIMVDRNREDRLATSVTDQMYQEAQELLRLFGVPFVVAPMEAEAQCAFMDLAGLTQGTITDDSDIWLFGGRTVYKNFFDQKKYVLEFKADNINHYFKLNRNGLVLLALLVGSDYTEGLVGVGPVTALEILATFPPPAGNTQDSAELLSCLQQFKQWCQSPAGHNQLAKKLRNIELHQGFPSQAVVTAYLQPRVDESREPFSWGSPDLSGLRDYAERKFGWSRNRTDQILLPVINKISQKTSQLTLHTFFGAIPNIVAHREQMSRRVQSAVSRLEGGRDDFELSQPSRPRQSRGRGRGQGRLRAQNDNVGNISRSTSRGRARARNLSINDDEKFTSEVIPQREKDRLEALKRKQEAVEIFKNKRKVMKRKNVRQIKSEAGLSESSSDES